MAYVVLKSASGKDALSGLLPAVTVAHLKIYHALAKMQPGQRILPVLIVAVPPESHAWPKRRKALILAPSLIQRAGVQVSSTSFSRYLV